MTTPLDLSPEALLRLATDCDESMERLHNNTPLIIPQTIAKCTLMLRALAAARAPAEGLKVEDVPQFIPTLHPAVQRALYDGLQSLNTHVSDAVREEDARWCDRLAAEQQSVANKAFGQTAEVWRADSDRYARLAQYARSSGAQSEDTAVLRAEIDRLRGAKEWQINDIARSMLTGGYSLLIEAPETHDSTDGWDKWKVTLESESLGLVCDGFGGTPIAALARAFDAEQQLRVRFTAKYAARSSSRPSAEGGVA